MVYTLFYRYRRLLILLLGLVAVAGMSALNSLPRQEDPELTERFGDFRTYLPGAGADRIEALITEKIENALQEIEEIKHLNSRSQTGISTVAIELDDRVGPEESAAVWSRIRNKVAEVEGQMPPDATVPDLTISTTAAYTLLVALTWAQEGEPQLDLLQRLGADLMQSVIALAGTKEVELYGEPDEEILVTVEGARLASNSLTAAEVAQAIRQADTKVSAGRVQTDRTELVVDVAGQLDSINRIRAVPLKRGADGHTVRVGDIASVEKTVRSPPQTMALIHGKRGIIMAAKMEANRRVDLWTADARRLVDRFKARAPDGVSVDIVFDQSRHTEERLDSLAENLFVGVLLVVIVLLLMMGWKSALLVATALPLTLLTVMAALNAIGTPLHQISLTGLIIALGLLIDNAIVAVDDYSQARAKGVSPEHAIEETVKHLLVPLIASTVTTILTFLPLVVMPGNVGEFVGSIGVSVILALVISLFYSLTVIPAMAGIFDPGNRKQIRRGLWRTGYQDERLTEAYRRFLDLVLRHPFIGILISITIPLSGFAVAGQLVDQFFPPVNRDQFQVQLKLPDQSSLAETEAAVRKANEILLSHPEVVNATWILGEQPPRVFYNVSVPDDGSPAMASGFVNTRSPEDSYRVIPIIQRKFLSAFPNAVALALPYEQGPPVAAPLEVRVYGPNLDELQNLGEKLRLLMAQSKNVTFTRATIAGGRPEIRLVPDEDEARAAGFELSEVARQLNANLDGVIGGSILEGTEELPVRVRIAAGERADLATIASTTLRAPGRAPPATAASTGAAGAKAVVGVPLNALARIEVAPKVNKITRRDGKRVNTVQAFVEPFTLPGTALADFRARLAASGLTAPAGYRFEFGGESEGSGEARNNLMSVLLPLVVLMAGTVVLAFNSFLLAGVIGLVGILSVGGALLTLWLFGYPMGFMAVIGIMGLIGLAINDSIVVLSALQADARARAADTEAIREIVIQASRHVISTTLTTIGGFIPLVIWGGIFWPPLAISVSGGMLGATLLALFMVPPLFTLIVRRQKRREDRRRALEAIAS